MKCKEELSKAGSCKCPLAQGIHLMKQLLSFFDTNISPVKTGEKHQEEIYTFSPKINANTTT